MAQPLTWSAVERELPEYSNVLRERLAEKGILYADMAEPFFATMDRTGDPHYSWPIDYHYNAKGYAILAEAVEVALCDLFRSETYPWNRFVEERVPEAQPSDRRAVE